MRRLFAFDLVILGYLAVITTLILFKQPEGTGIYLAYHAGVLLLIALLIYAEGRYGGRFWTCLRYWYVVPIILAAYRELHYLVPQIHPFDDHRYDRVLAALDRRWFGDVDRFFFAWDRPLLIDVLFLCYCFYYALILIPGAVLCARREFDRVREYASVVMTGMYLSYLGYVAVPAIGPHHFYRPRPAFLEGSGLGGTLHRWVLAMEWSMPDAFPSGHALMAMLVLATAWKHTRKTFWVILAPALGCILATVALRYHYVVDVAASVALAPAAFGMGVALHRRWDPKA